MTKDEAGLDHSRTGGRPPRTAEQCVPPANRFERRAKQLHDVPLSKAGVERYHYEPLKDPQLRKGVVLPADSRTAPPGFDSGADPAGNGPGSITLVDSDGNPLLIDQFF